MQHVRATPEFHRIKNLPRRKFDPTDPGLLELRDMLTEYLKTPDGEQELLPVQAFILKELYEHRGFIGSIPVGNGKTHPALLAPTLLESERPLLIVPAKHLREKTPRDIERLSLHWRIRNDIQLLSYEKLGVVSGAEVLFDLKPDLIGFDEMQYVKNRKGVARTKRLERYIRKHRPIILGLSGTFIDYSILQAWHLLYWAFPYTMPLPRKHTEVKQWSMAVEGEPILTGVEPGVLKSFCNLTEDLTDGLGRRIVETPGIVATNTHDVGATLTINGIYPDVPEQVTEAVSKMRATWETPGGEPFELQLDLWRHARELGSGFYYTLEEPAPIEWLRRRKAWSVVVRDVLKRSRKYDSPYQVALAAKNGNLPVTCVTTYNAWKEIRSTFKPITIPVWVSEYLIDLCVNWLRDNERGIVWCELKAFSEKLSEKSGFPYFCQQGRTKEGLFVEDHKGPCICSPVAVGDGYNLQYNWDSNLIVSCPPTNERIEQVLGRTHRQFQKSDEVTVGWVFTVQETIDGFKKMLWEANQYKTVLESKLLKADYVDMGFEVL